MLRWRLLEYCKDVSAIIIGVTIAERINDHIVKSEKTSPPNSASPPPNPPQKHLIQENLPILMSE